VRLRRTQTVLRDELGATLEWPDEIRTLRDRSEGAER
jgi:hypothetical protein